MVRLFIVFIFLFLVFPKVALARVVINEVLPNPLGNDNGAEWVELYNLDSQIQSLSGCSLFLHPTDSYQRVDFDGEDFVEKYKVVSWDGSFLNNEGDSLRLVCMDFTDSVSYGSGEDIQVSLPKEGFSFGRHPDGIGSFYILNTLTPGEANSDPYLSPTLQPLSVIPTLTPIVFYTPSLKPTNTPTLASKKVLEITPTKVESGDKVLEQRVEVDQDKEPKTLSSRNELTPTATPNNKDNKSVPFLAYFFIIFGVGLIGASFYLYFKSIKKDII